MAPQETSMPWPLWAIPALAGTFASLGIMAVSLPEPQPNKVAGVLMPFASGTSGLSDLLSAEPELAIVDYAWGGRLVYVVAPSPDFVAKAAAVGALLVFDAGAVGCGYRRPAGA